MPEYVQLHVSINDLRAKYDAETTRSENDFHTKYEEFLEGQRNFAPSILKKRQAELQELLDKNIAFKKGSLSRSYSAKASMQLKHFKSSTQDLNG